jgi:transcriptional regulator with XRE-family HTH domain
MDEEDCATRPLGQTHKRRATGSDARIGQRIRLRRRVVGMAGEELAKRLAITYQQVQKYERGENRISASRLAEIATILETPLPWFFEDDLGPPMLESEFGAGILPAHRTSEITAAEGILEPSSASAQELAELIKLFTEIPREDVRAHFLKTLRLFARCSRSEPT